MKQYAGQIRNIQREFRFEPTEFYDFTPAELEEIDKEHDEEAQMICYGTTLGY
jgi:hypothetical protein